LAIEATRQYPCSVGPATILFSAGAANANLS
jgi:hypothetical protein